MSKSKYDRKYKTLQEIQDTFEERSKDKNFDYYNPKNVCVIHAKFGDIRKMVFNLSPKFGVLKTFCKAYMKHRNTNYFPKALQISRVLELLDYVEMHQLPIIFYDNFNDKEISIKDLKDAFTSLLKAFSSENCLL